VTQPIRILLVAPAVFDRQAMRTLFQNSKEFTIIATCASGRELLEQLASQPDVVISDFLLGDMDCFELLREIRKRDTTLPVLVYAIDAGSDWQSRAIRAGITACITKAGSNGAGSERGERELLNKVKLCRLQGKTTSHPPRRSLSGRQKPTRCELVVVGTSTGGPLALPQVLSKLPANFALPIVIVQHMPNEIFTASLTQSLATCCPLPVKHAAHGDLVKGPGVWIAPGNHHLVRATQGLRIELLDTPPLNGVRPAVDHLFTTAASTRAGGVLGVVLTGMGRDGLQGAEAIVKNGGSVIVQDEATSVVWGMPGAVSEAGLAAAVLPLAQIAGEIIARASTATRAAV
jgi:two-component system, chemotaxis family, protein-glutamate methylesterase/glutaminase